MDSPRWRHGLATVAVVIVGVLVVAAVSGVFLLLGHQPRPATAARDPQAQQLIKLLGVLRRAQSPADRSLPAASFLRSPWSGPIDRQLTRLATVTPWGQKVFLVAFKPGPIRPIPRTLKANDPAAIALRAQMGKETLAIVTPWACGPACAASVGGRPAGVIASQGLLSVQGAGRTFAGGSTAARLIAVVPDGVARVVFVLPRQPSISSNPGGPVYKQALRVPVTVKHNVAAVQVDRECCDTQPPMMWYAPDGRLVHTVGNVAAAGRLVHTIMPAPETASSRAAEHDPSTPNRVWVTPLNRRPAHELPSSLAAAAQRC